MTPEAAVLTNATSPAGFLLVLALMTPAAGILLALVAGRHIGRIVLVLFPAGFAIAVAVFVEIWTGGQPLVYVVGAWPPPLGITLRADGLSAVMMLVTAVIVCAVGVFAHDEFGHRPGTPEARKPMVFWPLLLAVWGALNAVVLGGDLFNLYVALELLTFAAVPLVCLKGSAETVRAALRYLLFALFGSVLYLLGAAMLYGAYGTLDIALLSARVQPEPVTWIAAALMTMGLLAKTALFPMHLWLPPAHAGAPAAASAVLSGLVVKGSYVLLVRLWFDAMPGLAGPAAAHLLGALGAAAILYGSVLALRQQRLKLLVAYSTVAQIGYLFLMFPLAAALAPAEVASSAAWTGGWLQVLSHALAKAAMFMAAGLIAESLGHDRIADLGGIGRARPLTLLVFALAGVSLMGLPPSGGFSAKWLLLLATVTEGQWWLAAVILAGGLLAAGYVFLVLGKAFGAPAVASPRPAPVSATRESAALVLALCAVLLGVLPLQPFELLEIGR